MNLGDWLKRNECHHNPGTMTHIIMGAGKLCVPENIYDDFLRVYGEEVKQGHTTLAILEQPSAPVFRMYFGLDILDGEPLSGDSVLEIAREVQRIVGLFFRDAPDDTFKCVVSLTTPKEVTARKLGPKNREAPDVKVPQTKTGIHLNFPKLLVDLEKALQIRFSVVVGLQTKFGQRKIPNNPWCDVVDRALYNVGLKMMGSVQTTPCTWGKERRTGHIETPRCEDYPKRGKETISGIAKIRKKIFRRQDENFDYRDVMTFSRDEYKNLQLSELLEKYLGLAVCPMCHNVEWYFEDRFYSPALVLGKGGKVCDGDLSNIISDFHEQMRWTSIRARPGDETTPWYEVPKGHLKPTHDSSTACKEAFGVASLERVPPSLHYEIVNSDVHLADVQGCRNWKGDTITEEATLALITECVRSFDPTYANLFVKEAIETKKREKIKEGVRASTAIMRSSSKATAKMMSRIRADNTAVGEKKVTWREITTVMIRVGGEGSTYCQNKREEHSRNSVYFSLSQEGIRQKCFSRNCKGYHSRTTPVTTTLMNKLFPGGLRG